MRFAFPTRAALLLLAFAAAACTEDRAPTVTPPTDPGTPPPPRVIGLYEITITGIGSDEMTATAKPVRTPTGSGVSAALNTVSSGLILESVYSGSFSDGTRAAGGLRYLTSTFRVRNSTAGPLSNVTYIMAGNASTLPGTAITQLRKFDGTNADPSIGLQVTPTGVTNLGSDLVSLQSPYPDVLQAFTEAEVAAITPPAGVTNVFPYGFVVRNKNTNANRTLPSAAADPNQYDGLLTVAFRLPLQPTAAQDVFTLVFTAFAVEDTETRMTESIEESQDTAAVRRLRDRATSLGATTVTVLNGSSAVDPAIPDYPGQRQLCDVRTAGTVASPSYNIWMPPGPYVKISVLNPGEVLHYCAPYFRTGNPAAQRPATNVPYTVTAKALDRYGNVRTTAADTLHLVETNGLSGSVGSPVALASGSADLTVTYSSYGTSILGAVGRRLVGYRSIPVAGVVRTWTAGAGTTDWNTNNNWSPAAVPMSLDSVYVPVAAPLDPVLASNVQVAGVEVEDVALIALGAFDLTASGNVKAGFSGGITNTSGRLFLSGIARTVEGKVPTLRVTGTYSATTGTNQNINARAPIQVDAGRLTISGVRLQADAN